MKQLPCRRPKKSTSRPASLTRINPNAAGIDCGSEEHYVAVPADRDATPVRSFKTVTAELHRLADWLTACGVTTVAMESTGVYWILLYEILESRGLDVVLVNARHVKNVPGRKTDVVDCQWLQELHSVGLLRGSFRPTAAIAALRAFLRHRETLVQSAAIHVQRMQKALVQMNLQLPTVISDIIGPCYETGSTSTIEEAATVPEARHIVRSALAPISFWIAGSGFHHVPRYEAAGRVKSLRVDR
jgi:transposase